MADVIGPFRPPLRTFAARLVELEHAVGLRPAEVERHAAAGDDRPRTVLHLPSCLVFVEAEMEKRAQIVPGLRHAAADYKVDLTSKRICIAEVVLRLVTEERTDVTECGEPHTEHVRVTGSEDNLVELGHVIARLEADLRRVVRAQCRFGCPSRALRPCPVTVRDHRFAGDDPFHRLVIPRDKNRIGVICHVERLVGKRRALHDDELRRGTRAVHDAAEHSARDDRAVAVFRHRNLDPIRRHGSRKRGQAFRVGWNRRSAGVIALPTAVDLYVAGVPAVGWDRHPIASVRDVVPHQTARGRHVDPLGDEERGNVVRLAVGTQS